MAENVRRNIWDALYEVKTKPFAGDNGREIFPTADGGARGKPMSSPASDVSKVGSTKTTAKVAESNIGKGSGSRSSTGKAQDADPKLSPRVMPSLNELRNKLRLGSLKSSKTDRNDNVSGSLLKLPKANGVPSAQRDVPFPAQQATEAKELTPAESGGDSGPKSPILQLPTGTSPSVNGLNSAERQSQMKASCETNVKVHEQGTDSPAASSDADGIGAQPKTPVRRKPECSSVNGKGSPRNMFKAFSRIQKSAAMASTDSPLDLSSYRKSPSNSSEPDLCKPKEDNVTFDGGTDTPLDLSVKKVLPRTSYHSGGLLSSGGVLPPSTGVGFNSNGAISPFRSFSGSQDPPTRKVSPVRPHVRGLPVEATHRSAQNLHVMLETHSNHRKSDSPKTIVGATSPMHPFQPALDQQKSNTHGMKKSAYRSKCSDSVSTCSTTSSPSPSPSPLPSPSPTCFGQSPQKQQSSPCTVLNVPCYEIKRGRSPGRSKSKALQSPLKVQIDDADTVPVCRHRLPTAQVPPSNISSLSPASGAKTDAVEIKKKKKTLKTAKRSPRSPSSTSAAGTEDTAGESRRLLQEMLLEGKTPSQIRPVVVAKTSESSSSRPLPLAKVCEGLAVETLAVANTSEALSTPVSSTPQTSPSLGSPAPPLYNDQGPATATMVSPPRVHRVPLSSDSPFVSSDSGTSRPYGHIGILVAEEEVSFSDEESSEGRLQMVQGITPLSPASSVRPTCTRQHSGILSPSIAPSASCQEQLSGDGEKGFKRKKCVTATTGSSSPTRSEGCAVTGALQFFLQADPPIQSQSFMNSTSLVASFNSPYTPKPHRLVTPPKTSHKLDVSNELDASPSKKGTPSIQSPPKGDPPGASNSSGSLHTPHSTASEEPHITSPVSSAGQSGPSQPKISFTLSGIKLSPFCPTSQFSIAALESSRRCFFSPIAFTERCQKQKPCGGDIRSTRYYRCHVSGKEDLRRSGEDFSEVKTKPGGLAFEPSGNWREDMQRYKRECLRIPASLVHCPGQTRAGFVEKPPTPTPTPPLSADKMPEPSASDMELDGKKKRQKRKRPCDVATVKAEPEEISCKVRKKKKVPTATLR